MHRWRPIEWTTQKAAETGAGTHFGAPARQNALTKNGLYLEIHEESGGATGQDRKPAVRSSFQKVSAAGIAGAAGRARRARCPQKSFRAGAPHAPSARGAPRLPSNFFFGHLAAHAARGPYEVRKNTTLRVRRGCALRPFANLGWRNAHGGQGTGPVRTKWTSQKCGP